MPRSRRQMIDRRQQASLTSPHPPSPSRFSWRFPAVRATASVTPRRPPPLLASSPPHRQPRRSVLRAGDQPQTPFHPSPPPWSSRCSRAFRAGMPSTGCRAAPSTDFPVASSAAAAASIAPPRCGRGSCRRAFPCGLAPAARRLSPTRPVPPRMSRQGCHLECGRRAPTRISWPGAWDRRPGWEGRRAGACRKEEGRRDGRARGRAAVRGGGAGAISAVQRGVAEALVVCGASRGYGETEGCGASRRG